MYFLSPLKKQLYAFPALQAPVAIDCFCHYKTKAPVAGLSGFLPCRAELFQLTLIGNRQFLAALCTAARQHLAAIGGLHAFAKTVNGLAALPVRLKCTFHIY